MCGRGRRPPTLVDVVARKAGSSRSKAVLQCRRRCFDAVNTALAANTGRQMEQKGWWLSGQDDGSAQELARVAHGA